MEEYLVLLSGIFFIAFLLPVRARKYFGMLGWTGMVLFLFAEIPYYFSINNFLYPLIAVLSVPFLAITVKYMNRENLRVMQLTRAASVAFLIYAPFAFTPLGDWLISVVVGQVVWLLDAFGYPASLYAWNTIIRNGFRVEIILACTGIQAIAIMLGVAAAVKTTMRQKVAAFLLVVPTIYILNLIRNTAVIIAYTEQWFPYLTEIAGNGELGYESLLLGPQCLCRTHGPGAPGGHRLRTLQDYPGTCPVRHRTLRPLPGRGAAVRQSQKNVCRSA